MSTLTPGRYLATVTASAFGKTGTGNEQLVVGFDVHAGADQQSQPMTWYGYFTDKAWPTTEKALLAMGWNPADHDYNLAALGPAEPTDTPLKGAEVELVLEDDPDQDGNARLRVRWVNPVGGGGLAIKERMDPAAATSFATGLRARLIAANGPGKRPASAPTRAARPAPAPVRQAPPAAAPKGDTINFDDIPF